MAVNLVASNRSDPHDHECDCRKAEASIQGRLQGPTLRGVADRAGCLLVSALSAIPRSVVVDQIVYRHEVDEQAISVRPILLLPCRGFVSRLSPLRTLGILRLAHGDFGLAVPRQGSVLRLINHQIGPQPFSLDESLGRELVLRTKGQDSLAANLCDVDSHEIPRFGKPSASAYPARGIVG